MPEPVVPFVAERRRLFGNRLRALRRQAGLTQHALGKAAGMDNKTISRVEGGVNSLSLDRVFLLAAALGRPPKDLFRWSEPRTTAAQAEPGTVEEASDLAAEGSIHQPARDE